eukprot:TRINITY_DN929_c0_g1_i3.p1 TRINITY_DN929_c0_g1~~TRINITY_DN929_c0_g1_i3.p1  ORF type:complete len:360 (+),score=74.17 TRINITY_DN929_c0_g1_i3:74-1153(+)
MSGYVGNLSAEQAQVLAHVKHYLQNYLPRRPDIDDAYILRFCRARKFDAQKAGDMLLNHLNWYEKNDVANIIQRVEGNREFDALRQLFPAAFISNDLQGSPVYVECLGRLDPKGLLKKFSRESLVQYHIYLHEKGRQLRREASARTGKTIETSIFISDVDGLGWQHFYKPGLSVLQEFIHLDEQNYPETMKRLYVIRTPKVFNMIWAIIKPWLDEITLSKVAILGYNYHDTLVGEIGMQNLPKEYGGQLDRPGGVLPIGGLANSLHTSNDTVTMSVNRQSSHEVVVNIDKPGSRIAYDFHTENHDICFGILYENSDGSREEIEPMMRHDCYVEPVQVFIVLLFLLFVNRTCTMNFFMTE